jgi:hypothetical protein
VEAPSRRVSPCESRSSSRAAVRAESTSWGLRSASSLTAVSVPVNAVAPSAVAPTLQVSSLVAAVCSPTALVIVIGRS